MLYSDMELVLPLAVGAPVLLSLPIHYYLDLNQISYLGAALIRRSNGDPPEKCAVRPENGRAHRRPDQDADTSVPTLRSMVLAPTESRQRWHRYLVIIFF